MPVVRTGFLLALCWSLWAQSASLEGTVVDQTTGKPLSGVHITLYAQDAYGAISTSSGRFSVDPVPPGRYTLLADCPGYLLVDYASLVLKPGERAKPILYMARASLLLGRVLDQYGDPVSGVRLEVLPVPPAKLLSHDWIGTDERGEFRIFAAPGKYYLKADPQRNGKSGPAEVRTDGTSEIVYAPTYYPNSLTKERAGTLEVLAGRDVDGLLIHLQPGATHPLTVSGTVRGIPSDTYSTRVTLQPTDRFSYTTVGQDGKFSVSGLSPGVYDISASSAGPGGPKFGRTTIRLESADATNVDLTLYETGEITGTLEVNGAASRLFKVRLSALNSSVPGTTPSADVTENGSFRLTGVFPAKYRVSVDPLPETAYVKAMELDGIPISDATIDIVGGTVPHLKISLGMDGAIISGRVLDKDGEEPVERTTVVLLADPKTKGEWASWNDGRFTFRGIRPGKYRLIAVLRSGDFNPEAAFAKGEDIEVKAGDRIVKDVTYAK